MGRVARTSKAKLNLLKGPIAGSGPTSSLYYKLIPQILIEDAINPLLDQNKLHGRNETNMLV